MAKIIDGKLVSTAVKDKIKEEVALLKNKNIQSLLAVIIVGDNSASRVYVNNKKKACEYCGIISEEYALPESTTTDELLALIEKLNNRVEVNGILVQLPLPKQIDEKRVLDYISPEKDVDAFHPVNAGKVLIGQSYLQPCTPSGVIEMLKYYNIDINGKNCVVIGRSNIVGKPMALLLLQNNGTVTICHSKTSNIKEICKKADILVSAIGKAKLVDDSYIKDGSVVIDVGMNRDENGKLCGDVDFDKVVDVCSYITPVPGGVGPMTSAMLMSNTLKATKVQNNII